jgi:hypothetical protein
VTRPAKKRPLIVVNVRHGLSVNIPKLDQHRFASSLIAIGKLR